MTILLAIEGLQAHYSSAQVLHDVTFSMGKESVAIVGRNGMGKTTLCNAIMGFTPPRASGSVRFEGKELIGRPPHKIARAGLGYVPQGRRLFPSLTVHEHLVIAARKGGAVGPRTASTSSSPGWPNGSGTVAPSFPAASSRCSRSAGRCSAIRGS